MAISPARTAAFDVLLRIERDRAFASMLLPQFEAALEPADRALCHEITLGTLRSQILLDHYIEQKAKGKKIDVEVRIALRMGIYQLLFLDRIPDHSAINESVTLAARAKKTSAKGFVNAILRNIAREGVGPLPADDSLRTSHPQWLLDRWTAAWGQREAIGIAEANNVTPRTAMRAATEDGARMLMESAAQASDIVPGCFLSDRVTHEMRAASDGGDIYFQDEGSQLVGQVAVSADPARFLDVCAAPGGKTTQAAASLPNASILAGDFTQARVALLADISAKYADGRVDVVRYDAEKSLPFADLAFDSVLLDAPCSGTGTIRHNPELRYLVRPEDIPVFAKRQLAILNNASNAVAEGGHLIYSTCSLEIEENEDVVLAFLANRHGWTIEAPQVPEKFLTESGFARTFPHRDDMDGFFIAVLRKA